MLRLFVAILLIFSANAFQIGVGISDITGPVAEINFMGYAAPGQRGSGIHLRLRSRAFVAYDAENQKSIAFVSVDGGMGSDIIRMRVIEKVNDALGTKIYSDDNLSISGTHTHSGPAGFLQYVLFQVTSLGYVKETFDTWVSAISNSIIMAHKNLQEASTLINNGELYDANINRSPTSYLRNSEEERNLYPEGDTDKNMLLLKFVSESSGKTLGVFNWFAVHGTSMNNTNTLTSGDNRGYASYVLEKEINGPNSVAGQGPFVAAFASTNLGDVSPNTNGAKCIDTGLPCDGTTSTCNGRNEMCIAFGPGTNGDMFESTQIIGNKQYEHAKKLMDTATESVVGSIDYRHSFVDMSKLNVTLADGSVVTLCSPAMGYSFAAGTTDGPGMFGFTQGTTSGNPFWDKVSGFLSKPTEEEIACQAPKPILLNTGDIQRPYEWDPKIVPLQILQLGNVYILSLPCELTTMAGRRMRNAVRGILEEGLKKRYGAKAGSLPKIYVTIAGLANSYSSYVTTYEEYQAQRYEAASTIFGPHTLEGYIQEFSRLARDLVNGEPSETGPSPPDLTEFQIQLMPEPKFDRVPQNVSFGDIVDGMDVRPTYTRGELVTATFHAANPRHNQRLEGSYMYVEQQGKFTFTKIATDGDWETKFHWLAGPEDPLDFGIARRSTATLSWSIPNDIAVGGSYRLCYNGDHKVAKVSKVVPFTGCSSVFQIVASHM